MSARRPLAALLGVALTVSMAGHTATAEAAKKKKRKVETSQVRVVTYNAASFVDHARAAADVSRLAGLSDVVALQEMASAKRRKMVREALIECDTCVFEGYMPREAVPGGTPILYRKDKFNFVTGGTTQVSEATYVGPKGAGPSTLRAKYVNWVQLQELRTGRDVFVLNNHTVPSVQGPKGGANRKMAARLELYRQHMTGLTELVTQFQMTGGVVFVTGDLNVNYRKDRKVRYKWFPYVTMQGTGLRSSFQMLGEPRIGTHGKGTRLIDYVAASNMAGVTANNQAVLKGYSSDHRPVLVTYTLTKPTQRTARAH